MSVDSWMVYSGGSPTSSTLGECSSSEEASSSSLTTFDLLTSSIPTNQVKRIRQVYETEEDDDDDDLSPCVANLSLKRVKRSAQSSSVDIPSSTKIMANKRRFIRPVQRVLSSSPADPNVDVRMIDFAHTTFSTRRSNGSNTTVHQGPDCGFLTGLDSLKRLLLEILAEENGDL